MYDARHIAGYCTEVSIWRILDTVLGSLKRPAEIGPTDFYIIDDRISLKEDLPDATEAECAWSIGALASYLSSGRMPFGGRGKDYQAKHPHTPLPSVRPEHQSLQPLINECLKADASQRVSFAQLKSSVKSGLTESQRRSSSRPKTTADSDIIPSHAHISAFWPEEF